MKYKGFWKKIDLYNDKKEGDMIGKGVKLDERGNYEYVFTKSSSGIHIVEVYLDDKLVLKGEYCILGMYNIQLSVWYWSWNIVFVNKKLIGLVVEKVKGYNKVIEDKFEEFERKDAELLHYFVGNDNFYIMHDNMDKLVKLGLYLVEGVWYFPIKKMNNDMHMVEYIIITKVLQY